MYRDPDISNHEATLMSLYNSCIKYSDEISIKDKINRALINHNGQKFTASSIPQYLNHHGFEEWNNLDVFYISDIHLDHHIVSHFPNGASDIEIQEYIKSLAQSLYYGKIAKYENPIILFGGDIGSDFQIVEYFGSILNPV